MNIAELQSKTTAELQEIARRLEVNGYSKMRKDSLIMEILRTRNREGRPLVYPRDFGGAARRIRLFAGRRAHAEPRGRLRFPVANSSFHLRTGDVVLGQVRPPKENERYFALLRVVAVNSADPEQAMRRPSFDDLTPVYPDERIRLEVEGQKDVATRLIDIIAPLGKGQRAMIVAPPKAGKTTVLKKIANSVSTNHPEIDLIVLLIDERPEEVTDMQRSVDGDVVGVYV